MLAIKHVHGIVIERRQRTDNPDHNRHRVGVTPKAIVEPEHLLVQQAMAPDRAPEVFVLGFTRQLTKHQQVSDLDKVAFFR